VVPYLPATLVGWARAAVLTSGAEPAWRALGSSLSLIVLAVLAAWLILRRQEL